MQISIITPIYNAERYLPRCLDSILAQTFCDFELILINDGSTDSSGRICEEYAARDSRIHVIHQENAGLSAARNAGLDWMFAHSDSEWLTFVDSDDWIHPQTFEQLYRAVQEHRAKVSICGYAETTGENPWIEDRSGSSEMRQVEQFYVENCVNATAAWAKLYHRDCFSSLRFPVGKIFEDEYTTYKILFQYPEVPVIEAPMYAYFVNPEGITKSKWTPARLDKFGACEEQIRLFGKNGFYAAYAFRINTYIRIAAWQYKVISQKENFPDKDKYLKIIRKKMKWLFFRYFRHVEFKKELIWIYEVAFPGIMNIYWTCCGIKEKIVRRK